MSHQIFCARNSNSFSDGNRPRRHIYFQIGITLVRQCFSVSSATHCNTLQHTATHCNILQYTATHCNTLQNTAAHCDLLQHTTQHCTHVAIHCTPTALELGVLWCVNVFLYHLQHATTYCNILQHAATHCHTLQHAALNLIRRTLVHRHFIKVVFNTLQHTATHCNTPQHTVTDCNTLQHTVLTCCKTTPTLHPHCTHTAL